MGALGSCALVAALLTGDVVADSLDAIDAVVASLPAGADVADAIESTAHPAWWMRGPGDRASLSLVRGYRREEFAMFRHRGVAVSARRAQYGVSAWADYRGTGSIERVSVGRVRFAMGEGLVAGVGSSPLGAPPRVGHESAFTVTTSASRLRGRRAAAVVARAGRHRVGAFASDDEDGRRYGFAGVDRATDAHSLGAGLGTLPSPDGAVQAFSVFATGSGARAEMAAVGEAVLAALRWHDGPWALHVRSDAAPAGYGERFVDGASLRRRRRSVGVARTLARFGVSGVVWAASASDDEPLRRRVRRRVEVSIRWRGAEDSRWDARVRADAERWTRLAGDALETRPDTGFSRRLEARLGVEFTPSPWFQHGYRIRVRTDAGSSAPAVFATARVGCRAGRLRFTASISDYSIPGDDVAYVLRPTAPIYDAVAAVSRSGSDLSARVDLDAGVRCSLYVIQPWKRAARVRLAVRWGV